MIKKYCYAAYKFSSSVLDSFITLGSVKVLIYESSVRSFILQLKQIAKKIHRRETKAKCFKTQDFGRKDYIVFIKSLND